MIIWPRAGGGQLLGWRDHVIEPWTCVAAQASARFAVAAHQIRRRIRASAAALLQKDAGAKPSRGIPDVGGMPALALKRVKKTARPLASCSTSTPAKDHPALVHAMCTR